MNNTPTKFELKPLIYSYFESVLNEEPHIGKKEWSTLECKSDWCQKKIAIRSNMYTKYQTNHTRTHWHSGNVMKNNFQNYLY